MFGFGEKDSWLEGIGVDVSGVLGKIDQAATSVADKVGSAASSAFDSASGAASSAYDSASSAASSAYDSAASAVDSAGAAAKGAYDAASNKATSAAKAVSNAASGAAQKATGAAKSAYEAASNAASDAVDSASGAAGEAWDWGKDFASGAVDTAGDAASGVADAAGGAWDWGKDFAGKAADAAGDAASGVADTAGGVWDWGEDFAGRAADGVSDAASGVAGAAGSAWDWGKDLAGKVADGGLKSAGDESNSNASNSMLPDFDLKSLAGTKITVPFPEKPFGPKFAATSKLRGGFKIKTELTLEIVAKDITSGLKAAFTTNKGLKVDVELAKLKDFEITESLKIVDINVTQSNEASAKKIDISIGIQGKVISTKFPHIQGPIAFKFQLAGAEWEKLQKNPDEYALTQIGAEGGIGGEVKVPLDDVTLTDFALKINFKAVVSASIGPNWPVILRDVGQRLLPMAGGALVPIAAVAGGIAGGLLLTAGVCAGIGKLKELGEDAVLVCDDGARQLNDYARSYGSAMRGKPGGNSLANKDAEARVQQMMTNADISRDAAVEIARNSGQKFEEEVFAAVLPKLREQVIATYKEREGRIGWLFGENVLNQVMNQKLYPGMRYSG